MPLEPEDWGVNIPALGYLLHALEEMGWCNTGFAGPEPLRWGDVRDYAAVTGSPFTAREYRALTAASKAFVSGFRDKRRADPALWTEHIGYLRPLRPEHAQEVEMKV